MLSIGPLETDNASISGVPFQLMGMTPVAAQRLCRHIGQLYQSISKCDTCKLLHRTLAAQNLIRVPDYKAEHLDFLGLWLLSADRATNITQANGHKYTGPARCTTDFQLIEMLLLRGACTAEGIDTFRILYCDSETEVSWDGRPGEAVCGTTWHGPLVESQIQRL